MRLATAQRSLASARIPGPGEFGEALEVAVTYLLVGLSVLATVGTWFGENGPVFELLLISTRWSGLAEIHDGQLWRLITPAFVHLSLMHIVFNMLWLWDLGGKIEQGLGRIMLLIFFLVTASMSNLAQFTVSGPLFGGMSGVVYGLLGFVWMHSRYNPFFFYYLHRPVVWMMLIWYVVCFTGLVGNIANTAHTTGLVIGIVWGYVHATLMRRRLHPGKFTE